MSLQNPSINSTLNEKKIQTETDLVNKRISQEALIRQQDIQTRLLAAENAEKERDQDEQRESKEGKENEKA